MSHSLKRVSADMHVSMNQLKFVSGSEHVWNLSTGPRTGLCSCLSPVYSQAFAEGAVQAASCLQTFLGKQSPEPLSSAEGGVRCLSSSKEAGSFHRQPPN